MVESMSDLSSSFSQGGSMMAVVLLLDVAGLLALLLSWLVALVARIRGRTGFFVKTIPALVMMGAFLPAIAGLVGYLQGRSAAIAAASHASPAMREELLAHGLDVALIPLQFGGVSTILLGSMAVLALMIAPWSARR